MEIIVAELPGYSRRHRLDASIHGSAVPEKWLPLLRESWHQGNRWYLQILMSCDQWLWQHSGSPDAV